MSEKDRERMEREKSYFSTKSPEKKTEKKISKKAITLPYIAIHPVFTNLKTKQKIDQSFLSLIYFVRVVVSFVVVFVIFYVVYGYPIVLLLLRPLIPS